MDWNMPASARRVGAMMLAIASLTATAGRAQVAGEPGAEAKRIKDAATVLAAVAAATANGIPRAVLEKAEAVAVFPYAAQGPRVRGQGPNQIRGDLQIGIRARGILSVRSDAGAWSPPAFVTLNGGGRQNADLVFVIPNRKGIDEIVGGERFALGGDGVTAAGPLSAAAAPDVTVLVYSQPRDWAAKTTFKGVTLSRDSASNQNFYGRPLTSRQAVAQADGPEPVAAWVAALKKHVR
jgi:lipid-binding SYLF domain-containing protein